MANLEINIDHRGKGTIKLGGHVVPDCYAVTFTGIVGKTHRVVLSVRADDVKITGEVDAAVYPKLPPELHTEAIARLEYKPGDCVAIHLDAPLSDEARERIGSALKEWLPDAKVLVLSDGARLSVIGQEMAESGVD